MNCFLHPDAPATAFCRQCGKALCDSCQYKLQGTVFCQEHRPNPQEFSNPMEHPNPQAAGTTAAAAPHDPYASPYSTAGYHAQQQQPGVVDPSINPGFAFLLGLIPGVGAIYNGQYAKGLIHVVVLGLLITIANNNDLNGGFEVVFALSIAAWFFYMAFEAYHTAKRRMMGLPVDEFSSLVNMDQNSANRFPAGPLFLIFAGLFFLLANFDLIRVRDVIRFWPLGLIGLGAYMLYIRMTAAKKSE
ncbi:MAG: B-box zinc finger protein [Acidobacteria bacterium]|nr:B-box zinc finger protein [Acidobacteriota bacterium]